MRKPKTPLGAWIAGERRARGWKSEELAERLGLSPTTVRGWEAGRSVSQENLAALERLFGLQAPGGETSDQGALVEVVRELVEELRLEREERQRSERGRIAVLRAALAGQVPAELLDALVPPPLGDAGQ